MNKQVMPIIRFLVALECAGMVAFYAYLWARVLLSGGDFRLTFSGPEGSLGGIERDVEPAILVLLLALPLLVIVDQCRRWHRGTVRRNRKG